MKRVLPVFLAVCLLASVGIAAFADAAVSENQNAAMYESDTCVYDAVGKRLLVKSFEKKFKTPFGAFFCYEDEDGNKQQLAQVYYKDDTIYFLVEIKHILLYIKKDKKKHTYSSKREQEGLQWLKQ